MKMEKKESVQAVSSSLLSIILGLFIGCVILLILVYIAS